MASSSSSSSLSPIITNKNKQNKKRVLENFFAPVSQKRLRVEDDHDDDDKQEDHSKATATAAPQSSSDSSYRQYSRHANYPFPIPHLPSDIYECVISQLPAAAEGREIRDDQADLDLVYFQPYIPRSVERGLFEFLRRELFFYRVQYMIRRGLVETRICTPRL